MATSDNEINICARALLSIGAKSISSFEEGTNEAKVAKALYERAKLDLLSIYHWTFNRSETYLARVNSDNLARYEFCYEKPDDFLRAISVRDNSSVVPYTFRNGKINTDCKQPVLIYSYLVSEADMPPYFVSLLIDRLARDFLIPISGKHDDYAIYDRIYQNNLTLAKNADAMSKTPEKINTSMLLGVR